MTPVTRFKTSSWALLFNSSTRGIREMNRLTLSNLLYLIFATGRSLRAVKAYRLDTTSVLVTGPAQPRLLLLQHPPARIMSRIKQEHLLTVSSASIPIKRLCQTWLILWFLSRQRMVLRGRWG